MNNNFIFPSDAETLSVITILRQFASSILSVKTAKKRPMSFGVKMFGCFWRHCRHFGSVNLCYLPPLVFPSGADDPFVPLRNNCSTHKTGFCAVSGSPPGWISASLGFEYFPSVRCQPRRSMLWKLTFFQLCPSIDSTDISTAKLKGPVTSESCAVCLFEHLKHSLSFLLFRVLLQIAIK